MDTTAMIAYRADLDDSVARAASSLAEPRKAGERIASYVIEAVLGMGGMGLIYRALDTRLGRRVALKVLSPACADDAHLAARLLREARAAAALNHPNVVSIFDVGQWEGKPFVAMELVSGATLRELVGDSAIPVALRLRWLLDVALALDAAHRAGLIHRDIKPENIMVRDDGVVKVLDFGIARRSGDPDDPVDARAATPAVCLPTLTAAGEVLGTTRYLSPEQIREERLDGRADQFAWGVTAHELLTGRSPWGVLDGLQAVAAILTVEVEPPSASCAGLPPHVDAVLRRALAKLPCERFSTMAELAEALEPDGRDRRATLPSVRVTGHLPPRNDQAGVVTLSPWPRPRGRAWSGLLVGGLAFLLGSGAGLLVLKRFAVSSVGAAALGPVAPSPPP